jgi:DNA polymerase elongation subunit (family B)
MPHVKYLVDFDFLNLGTFHESKETKGLDIVRRDWCQLAKDTGKYVVQIPH